MLENYSYIKSKQSENPDYALQVYCNILYSISRELELEADAFNNIVRKTPRDYEKVAQYINALRTVMKNCDDEFKKVYDDIIKFV